MILLISKYRSQLMGISILWIMLYHMPYLNSIVGPIIGSAILIGFCGVDIFLFLSAFGLFYSLLKNPNILGFYYKRFVRIIPTYWIAVIVFGFFTNLSILDVLKEISMIGMFFPYLKWPMFDWYIPAQLFLYLLSPAIIFNIEGIKKYALYIFVGVVVLNYCYSIILLENSWDTKILFLITRIPAFVLGAIFAQMGFNRKKMSSKDEILSYIVMLVAIFALFIIKIKCTDHIIVILGLNHFPFLFAIPGFIFLLIRIFEILPKVVMNLLNFLGRYSLELYLIHWNLYRFRKTIPYFIGISEMEFLILCFIISFPLAHLFSKLAEKFTSCLYKLCAK